MPPAIIGAGIGAAASIGGAILGGKAQSKAADKASAAQDRSTEAQLEAQRLNAGLYRDVYNSNLGVLSPYNELGYNAASARNALLGLGAGPAYTQPPPLGGGATGGVSGGQAAPLTETVPIAGAQENALSYLASQLGPKRTRQYNAFEGDTAAKTNFALSLAHKNERNRYNSFLQANPLTQTVPIAQPAAAASAPAAGAAPGTPQQDYGAAFQNYLDSTGYKFQLDEGLKGLSFAKRLSSVDSGDMVKSAMNYNRGMGQQYFGDYMGMLGQQQGMGLGAASAVAGQGSQYAANMANSNNMSGNALAQGAVSQGNMALVQGQNTANMYGNIAGGIGNAVGSLWRPSSYQQANPYQFNNGGDWQPMPFIGSPLR